MLHFSLHSVLDPDIAQHPVEAFWPERFLSSRRARLVKAGIAGNWFPFGGGASRCPGESIARYTTLSCVATVLKSLDVRLSDPGSAAKVGSRHRTLPFGLHSFDKPVICVYEMHYVCSGRLGCIQTNP
jgi:cytochrome P450